ncbi:MAG: VWA domain-containing protein, partial [Gammaproteobacteria bacterium]|nr:VWA domain-containing protein [Gammaproteobacteria bacterium]
MSKATDLIDKMSDFEPEEQITQRVVGFIRFIHDNGFRIGVQEELDGLRVARHCNLLDQKRLRWGLRSLLCSSSEEWQEFDELFDAYWKPPNRTKEIYSGSTRRKENKQGLGMGNQRGGSQTAADADKAEEGDDSDAGDGGSKGGASRNTASVRSDFRHLTDEHQMREMERLVERLAKRMRRRIIRRQQQRQKGRIIHMRRTIRNSLRFGGTPLKLYFRRNKRQLPKLVVLLDVSRSMSLYSYLFLRFARGVVDAFNDADAYVFHTKLIHITEALQEKDTLRMKEKLAMMAVGLSGGTRIGECLQSFNQDYGRRIINSRT